MFVYEVAPSDRFDVRNNLRIAIGQQRLAHSMITRVISCGNEAQVPMELPHQAGHIASSGRNVCSTSNG